MTRTQTPTDFNSSSRVQLATHDRYSDAQRTVDALSDAGFPVEHVSIVWSGLRHIERVTGRRTVARAALEGALSGAWFGAFIGFLLTLFVELDPDVSGLGLVVSYALVGALVGAIFLAVQHWLRRGARDFSSIGTVDAETYEIWVEADHVVEARRTLDTLVTAGAPARSAN